MPKLKRNDKRRMSNHPSYFFDCSQAKERYNLTNRKKLSPKAIDRFAGKLLAQAKSKYDRGALTERLNALFDYMANSGNELVIKNGLAHIILTTKMLEVKK